MLSQIQNSKNDSPPFENAISEQQQCLACPHLGVMNEIEAENAPGSHIDQK